ncbi:MAG: mannose-6-phosphate isomerase [Ruminococcaceae bacterium]|nr:mannose-6-phosphate isomerase [Oscillospiraceae bacterium]
MIKEPIFFERNRVGRVYTGGMLFSNFFGDPPIDNFEPEEWIASNVRAINKVQKSEKEGVSKAKNPDFYFDELLEKYPEELLGKNNKFRILVKGLDSAIRLPAQAHPDRTFSQKYLNSAYGKTECWVILDKRPGAKIFFGFKDGVTKDDFEKAIDASEFDKDAMERLMLEIEPEIGDVFLVPGRTVHAIGKGCLILEIQEPTDFTIQPEYYCGDYKLSHDEMYLGLSREIAVSCFDFGKAPDAKLIPKDILKAEKVNVQNLVGTDNTDCFIVNRIILNNGEIKLNVNNSYAVYIVTSGNGTLIGRDYVKEIKKGDYFFMPAVLMDKFTVKGNIEIIECY